LGELLTEADLAAFSIRQEEAFQTCDQKRAALVSILDARK